MKNEDIKCVFDDVQKRLEMLQGSEASFLFISYQGNRFVLGGQTHEIGGQLLFEMMRYPIVRDIIKECAVKYDEMDAKIGNRVREMKMDHLIEQNSGNGN